MKVAGAGSRHTRAGVCEQRFIIEECKPLADHMMPRVEGGTPPWPPSHLSARLQTVCLAGGGDFVFDNYLSCILKHTISTPAAARLRLTMQTRQLMRHISPLDHDLALQNYWQKYNAIFPIVDRRAFEASLFTNDTVTGYWSHALHYAMLAMGLHLADELLPADSAGRSRVGDQSFCSKNAKHYVWDEIDDASVATAAGLIILGDLEFQVGDADLGRRFSGTSGLPVEAIQQGCLCQLPWSSMELSARVRHGTSYCTRFGGPTDPASLW
jgi:hypothetical protein